MTGKNRRHYHCKALNSLLCADVPLRNYSLTHSRCCFVCEQVHCRYFRDKARIVGWGMCGVSWLSPEWVWEYSHGKILKFNAKICAFWQAECNNLRSVQFGYYPSWKFHWFSRWFVCISFPGNKRGWTPILRIFAADADEYVYFTFICALCIAVRISLL